MRWIGFLIFSFVFLVFVAGVVLWRLADHDLERRASEPFNFLSNDHQLTGTLWLPEGPVVAAVALVHGDGPQERTSAGGYAPLINTLLDAGIAVASWDKPGVGGSQGNWLDQSMEERASEASSALNALTLRFEDINVGALGFSQAGWVLPRLPQETADFIVLVGPAVSWQDQGTYYTRTRLRLAGASEAEIAQTLAAARLENERIFGPNAGFDLAPVDMNRDRWAFIQRNRNEDARDYLRQLSIPTLAMWGQDDAAIYLEDLVQNHPANRVVIVADATHGLLRASPYNAQLVSDWSFYCVAMFLLQGRYAYAPGAIDQIVDWIEILILPAEATQ